MPPKAVQRTKEQKLQAALAGARKGKKKKWSKGRVREKKNNTIIFNPDTYESAVKEIPKLKNITVATVSEKLRITGSLAQRFIRKLAKDGHIKKVYDTAGFLLYTRDKDAVVVEDVKIKKGKEGKSKAAKEIQETEEVDEEETATGTATGGKDTKETPKDKTDKTKKDKTEKTKEKPESKKDKKKKAAVENMDIEEEAPQE